MKNSNILKYFSLFAYLVIDIVFILILLNKINININYYVIVYIILTTILALIIKKNLIFYNLYINHKKLIRAYINEEYQEFEKTTFGSFFSNISLLPQKSCFKNFQIFHIINDIIILCLFLIFISYKILLILLISLIIEVLLFSILNSARKKEDLLHDEMLKNNEIYLTILNSILNSKLNIIGLGKEQYFIKKNEEFNNISIKSRINFEKTFYLQKQLKILIEFIPIILYLLFIVLFSNFYVSNNIAFNIFILYFITGRLSGLYQNIIDLKFSNKFYKKLNKEIKQKKQFVKKGFINKIVNGSIKKDGIILLNNINIDIKDGDKILIIGDSGAGKTTLIKGIIGLYKIEADEISFIKKDIGFVRQDSYIFNDSYENNISLGKFKAGKNNNILNLDDSIKRNLISFGKNLSGGEKTKIAINRAFYHSNQIFVFDEANRNIPYFDYKKILDIVLNIKNSILINVSHVKENFDMYNKIILISNNNISYLKNENR